MKHTNLFRSLRNRHGYGMVEVLAASAVGLIMMGAFASMVTYQTKAGRRVADKMVVYDIANSLRSTLSCQKTFENILPCDPEKYITVLDKSGKPVISAFSLVQPAGNTNVGGFALRASCPTIQVTDVNGNSVQVQRFLIEYAKQNSDGSFGDAASGNAGLFRDVFSGVQSPCYAMLNAQNTTLCPDGMMVTGLNGDGTAVCGAAPSVEFPGDPSSACPPGQKFVGMSGGVVQCESIVTCASVACQNSSATNCAVLNLPVADTSDTTDPNYRAVGDTVISACGSVSGSTLNFVTGNFSGALNTGKWHYTAAEKAASGFVAADNPATYSELLGSLSGVSEGCLQAAMAVGGGTINYGRFFPDPSANENDPNRLASISELLGACSSGNASYSCVNNG